MGIPVVNYTPSKDKTRLLSKCNIANTRIRYGARSEERWAEELIEECAAFPFGDHVIW